jgi:rhodanese-related sulfurtransferase
MKIKVQLIVILTAVFLASSLTLAQNQVSEISADTLNRWISEGKKVEMIYVGTQGDYAEAHIPGSVSLPFDAGFGEAIKKLSKKETYILICPTGGRSLRAAEFMLEKGFKNVYNLKGGITGWIRHGFKVEKSKLDG